MNYIIIDLEWNQAASHSDSVEGIPFEIIEIGAVKLSDTYESLGSFHQVISPKLYTKMHPFTEEVTHLTMDDLKHGIDFPTAMHKFLEWCGEDYRFCTWGPMDITELQRNMRHYGIEPFPFPVLFYDIQKIFSISFEDGKARRSLEYAVNHLKLKKKLSFHRAIDDAKYTANVFRHLDQNTVNEYYSIDTFQIPTDSTSEINVTFKDYSKYISKGFENKSGLMDDNTVTSTVCYKCNKRARKKIRWFSANSKIYYALSVCPEHGLLKGKIRIKKHDSGNYYAIKTLKLTDKTGAEKIREKQQEILLKKENK